MRLRHIKGCEDFITDAKECIREDKAIELKGRWAPLWPNMGQSGYQN